MYSQQVQQCPTQSKSRTAYGRSHKAAPKDYKAVVTAEQRLLGTAVTLADIESAMHQHWRSIKDDKSPKNDDDEELSLSTFEGNCFNSGKKGHKSPDCKECRRTSKASKGGKFTGKCNTCGKTGLMAKTCWENNDNAHLRPNNWSSNKGKASEVSAIATAVASSGRMELLLGAIDGVTKNEEPWCVLCTRDVEEDTKNMNEYVCDDEDSWQELNLAGISFPPTRALLTDPNVFFADTGSTVHSTRFKAGFKNAKKGTDDDAMTMGNGAREGTAMIGDLNGTMCDKEGHELGVATLKDVAYLPMSKFNLFSVTKLQREGWILHGHKNQIKLTKGTSSVVFDIVIDTPKGAIYGMYLKREMDGECCC